MNLVVSLYFEVSQQLVGSGSIHTVVVAHGCNIFHPCHNPACVVVVVTKLLLLLLLIFVIRVAPTIASGSAVSFLFVLETKS